MDAHVTTYRLSDSEELTRELDSGETLTDQAARTIASYYHSPSDNVRALTALSHGLPFDTEELREEIHRELAAPGRGADAELDVLLDWLDELEAHLS